MSSCSSIYGSSIAAGFSTPILVHFQFGDLLICLILAPIQFDDAKYNVTVSCQ
jgi:hypothetical protein